MAWNDPPLPLRGSVATDYPNIRRASKPTEADMAWADMVALVDQQAARRVPGAPPFPDTPRLSEVKKKAREAGVDPPAVVLTLVGMLSAYDGWGEPVDVLLVGPAKLSSAALLIASEEVKATIDLWSAHRAP